MRVNDISIHFKARFYSCCEDDLHGIKNQALFTERGIFKQLFKVLFQRNDGLILIEVNRNVVRFFFSLQ